MFHDLSISVMRLYLKTGFIANDDFPSDNVHPVMFILSPGMAFLRLLLLLRPRRYHEFPSANRPGRVPLSSRNGRACGRALHLPVLPDPAARCELLRQRESTRPV